MKINQMEVRRIIWRPNKFQGYLWVKKMFVTILQTFLSSPMMTKGYMKINKPLKYDNLLK